LIPEVNTKENVFFLIKIPMKKAVCILIFCFVYLVPLITEGRDGCLVDVLQQQDLDVGSVEGLEDLGLLGRTSKRSLTLSCYNRNSRGRGTFARNQGRTSSDGT
jgi:hypothetical protein